MWNKDYDQDCHLEIDRTWSNKVIYCNRVLKNTFCISRKPRIITDICKDTFTTAAEKNTNIVGSKFNLSIARIHFETDSKYMSRSIWVNNNLLRGLPCTISENRKERNLPHERKFKMSHCNEFEKGYTCKYYPCFYCSLRKLITFLLFFRKVRTGSSR